MSNPKISAKDLISKWGRKPTRKLDDHIAWTTMDKMISGLRSSSNLDLASFASAVAERDVGKLFAVSDSSLSQSKYETPGMLLQDRVIVEAFKKFSFARSPFNKREKAKLRFWEAEEMCENTNQRLKNWQRGVIPSSPAVEWIINHAQRDIAACLGSFRPNEMLDYSRFGPGATLCVTGAYTTPYFKLACCEPTVGSGAFAYAEALLNYDHKWAAFLSGMHPLDVQGRFNFVNDDVAPELSITDQNKVTFVPKNAKTERSIAIEPYFNLYFQLGVGSMLRSRLKKAFAIDLNTQKVNQDAAKIGSVTGELATIDFSMASDTIATEVVRLLMPSEWFSHLDRLRSRDFLFDGERHRYQKFSSMGNGFTFELETLIFSAVARASCAFHGIDPKLVVVYGDDVILPTTIAHFFIEVCEQLGFKTNVDKSFLSGPFRESCGTDYFEGQSVRPVYCQSLDSVRDVVSFANRLLALNRAVDFLDWDYSWLHRVVDHLLSFVPGDVRQHLVGPPSDSYDTYIHTDDIRQLAGSCLVKWNRPWQRWEHPRVVFRPRSFQRRGPAAALYMVQGLSPSQSPSRNGNGIWRGKDDVPQRTITGREIGSFGLSYNPLNWSFGGPCQP